MKDPNLSQGIGAYFYTNGYNRYLDGGGTERRYEEDLVNIWLSLINNYPEAIVLDFGSNIGVYTLASRIMGNKVIALDPDPENHALLFNSLVLNQKEEGTIQIRNAISNVYNEYRKENTNYGIMDLVEKEKKIDSSSGQLSGAWPIQSILLSDILDLVPKENIFIMKIDVQGFECRALTSYLKQKTKTKYLPYILMETEMHCKKNSNSPCEWATEFLPLLEASDYIPHVPHPIPYELLKKECFFDVLFVHSEAVPFHYMDPGMAKADFKRKYQNLQYRLDNQ